MNLIKRTMEKRNELRKKLREGYLASAERDAKLTAEWSHVDDEVWNNYPHERDVHDDCVDSCPNDQGLA